ncbi:MAG: SgcJ/EcaC family oxidoreductase [Cyanobacteria bacterium P01_A01_bin.3]
MERHPIEQAIAQADTAINREDFDILVDCYTDDAILVIQPGRNAIGKAQLRQAFEAIAAHFQHTLYVEQAGMKILETGDTALVLARTLISAEGHPTIEREATYVFRKSREGRWLCAIDNSYGHALLEQA